MNDLELPARYEPIAELGRGGGGQVWAVRDRVNFERYALKLLTAQASSKASAALVREAVAMSGLEGLGTPRVVRFGWLAQSGAPYLVRELVEGVSFAEWLRHETLEASLTALIRAAEQLTVLHRAGFLHGDVKAANIIVDTAGKATLVDLGLAAPWQEHGAPVEGLTPRYAAPELFAGQPLTVRAEVFALGVTLAEALALGVAERLSETELAELQAVVVRATAREPSARFPSVDEFASAIRRISQIDSAFSAPSADVGALWPVVGIDGVSRRLSSALRELKPSELLSLIGPPESGRSILLQRLGWSLSVEGQAVAWIAGGMPEEMIDAELAQLGEISSGIILVDDADALDAGPLKRIAQARSAGAKLVVVGEQFSSTEQVRFQIPPIEKGHLVELLRRAIPSLTDRSIDHLLAASEQRPGALRRLVRRISADAVVRPEDLEQSLGTLSEAEALPEEPLARAVYYLDRGRFTNAKALLDGLKVDLEQKTALAVARARLLLALGNAAEAVEILEPLSSASPSSAAAEQHTECALVDLYLGRAYLGVGKNDLALKLLVSLEGCSNPDLTAEALAYQALAEAYSGNLSSAFSVLDRAVVLSEADAHARVQSIVRAAQGVAYQLADRRDEARRAYEQSLARAEEANDAGAVAVAHGNLAGLAKMRGDIATAIEHFESAVDMGNRSGRRGIMREALHGLVNLDLYLGRLARARAALESLQSQKAQLSPLHNALLLEREAELCARTGELERSQALFEAAAIALQGLGRNIEAAEARLECILVAIKPGQMDLAELRHKLELARAELEASDAHGPLMLLASAKVATFAKDEVLARNYLNEALAKARVAGQKEWSWRALEARALLQESAGQFLLARRDREEALVVLEEMGARLPRDLREVYWNDPARRELRRLVGNTWHSENEARPEALALPGSRAADGITSSFTSSLARMRGTPLEQRLKRVLEINAELGHGRDLAALCAKITEFAIELARAERGSVILREANGSLAVYATHARKEASPSLEFSRSIAESVLSSKQPIITLNATDDSNLRVHASIIDLELKSIACVPILNAEGVALGALYLETRLKPGKYFERELPTLIAFAQQVAIALANARLLQENTSRAAELEKANAELEVAERRLRELLQGRTEQLRQTREKLRGVRETLYGHFGYQGLVGTSAAMRRIYAVIERLKDTDATVLIGGESGTGKEMVARAVHQASTRSRAKLLAVNCAAIPEALLESELFGYARGAFSGADRDRKGLIREAEGGSIFLDEVGEMSARMQASLLRVLQERVVQPLGSAREERIDVRFLFATNRNLAEMVQKRTFREDLFYRIQVVELRLPPLRDHLEDIPQLADHFMGLFAARYRREKKTLSRAALAKLMSHSWPGNIRELEHALLNAWVMSDEEELEAEDFLLNAARSSSAEKPASSRGTPASSRKKPASSRSEKERILAALKSAGGNRLKAAELCKMPRRTFYRRLEKYGIE